MSRPDVERLRLGTVGAAEDGEGASDGSLSIKRAGIRAGNAVGGADHGAPGRGRGPDEPMAFGGQTIDANPPAPVRPGRADDPADDLVALSRLIAWRHLLTVAGPDTFYVAPARF